MKNISIESRYSKVLETLSIPDGERSVLVLELARRHRMGWALPMTTYRRCKNLLFYKESLKRNSPYYSDLLKIENREDLLCVLEDLRSTMRIRNRRGV